jgi:D-3-phosphoglycerate dehydrogenase
VSLHCTLTRETRHLLGKEALAKVKPGVRIVNAARGELVDDAALLAALDDGRVAAAGLDVFTEEPPADWRLARHPKVVATPHLGASTVEAQDRVAVETVEMLAEALKGSPFVAAVNLPFPPGGDPHAALPWMRLAETVGRFLGHAAGAPPSAIAVSLAGVPESVRKACAVAAIRGVLSPSYGEDVNLVNAPALARLNGVAVTEAVRDDAGGYASLVGVTVATKAGARSASGTLFDDRLGRIVEFDGLPIEFTPEGTLLVITNRDVPGVVGRIGTFLAEKGINIVDLDLARGRGGRAAAVVRIDRPDGGPVEPSLAEGVAALSGIESARLVLLG